MYPNHTWMHNGVLTDRLLYQAIYIVIGCIFTWLGSWLIQLKLYVKSVRWPMLIGVALIICPLFLFIDTLRPVISYLLITIALFWFVPYIFKRDGSIRISSISAIVLIILSRYVYNPYGYLPSYCIIVIIAILIGYFFYGLTIMEDRTIRNIFKYIILNCEVRQNKISSLLYGIYTICIIEFLGIPFGYKLNDIYSLSALIFVCPLIIYLLSNYCHTIYSTTQRDCLYAVCLLSVIAIWGAQYSYAHFWLTISIWIIGIITIGGNSYRVFTNGTNKNRNYLFRTIASSILMYIVVAGCTPFLLMGYNITAFNYNSKVYNRSIYIKEADAKLLYVKNIDGKIGLMDRSGKIIIPTNFTEIIPNYYTSYDNLWDDNYRTTTSFSGFILIDDWQIGEWSVDTYVKNGELISLSESQSNQECKIDTVFNPTEEENRVKNQIVRLIKAQNKSIAKENNWRFNYKNPSHLKLLNTIDCDSIRPNLSVTSKSFHKCYLDTILPNLKVGDYGIVAEVMSSSYDWNSTIEKKSIEVECSDDYKKIISDNVTGKMLIQKDIASRLIRLAEIFENGDRFQETEYLSLLSFTKGKYQDMGKVLYLTSLLRQNKNDKAVMFINQKQNELYQESGYFPEAEYAWMHNTYFPLVWHLSSNDINKLKELGYVYSIEEELPFDRIQLLPDSINGNIYRYSKRFPLPNGFGRSYFYYVKDGKRITPPFSFWSEIMEHGDPHLVINCITKKRQFIKSQDIIGEEYTLEEISGDKDGEYLGPIYSKKYLNYILNKNPGKYKVTKSYRRAGSFPNTFLSPQIIKGEYDHAWPFSEGLAAVEIGGKIGFINREGDIVIEPQFKSPFSPVKGFLGDFYYIYSSKNLYNPYFRNGVCPVYNESGNLIWIDQIGKRTNKPVELLL